MNKKIITIHNFKKELKDNREAMNNGRVFYKNINDLRDFGNYCDRGLFLQMFGEEEGDRLWRCFVEDAGRDIFKFFLGYLKSDQLNVLVLNLVSEINLRIGAYEMED